MKPASPWPMLALIVAAFALPFALGAGLYLSGWQPANTVNHGELIRPPQPLPADGLSTPDGAPLATADLHGRWWLLLVPAGACAAPCLARAVDMRRVHVALNKNMGRLRRMVLTGDTGDGALAALRAAQPDLVVARPDERWRRALLGAPDGALYLVDPQARLVLRYAGQTGAESIRADLDRLLRHGAGG
jgi:hypothetical protein